ncbi:MAG: OOP family OmpA-OmpF porin [Saprospiraceae bacterium]|jgi:OOP family OmpA-OmpF porin
MTRKILLLTVCLFTISLSSIFSQNETEYSGLAIDATPKHQSEIGIHAGHFMVLGDILPRPSWGAGIHFRRAFDYAFAWRIDAMYGQALGLEPRNGSGSTKSNRVLNGDINNGLDYTATPWYANYKTKFMSLSVQGIWTLNAFNFKKQTRKVNWYVYGGVGVNQYKAYYDAKGSNGQQYDFSSVANGLDPENSKDDRKTIKDNLKDLLDGDYETRAETATGRRSGTTSDDDPSAQLNIHADAGVGVSFKLSEKINLSIDTKATIVFGNEGDLIDGYRWRTTNDLTQYRDMINYTSVRLNFNLGKRENRSEPLWWVSPLSLISEDLAEVKGRPIFDKTDADRDGVFDIVDDEKDTPEGYPVDTKGVQLDSDKDGVPDGMDKEPYTPPSLVGTVNSAGEGTAPDPGYVNEDDVNRIVDAKLKGFEASMGDDLSDWILPIINYDLDKYNIRASEFGKLHQVATLMKAHEDLKILVTGYTDLTAADCYNQVLSYNRAETSINYLVNKYGISKDRLVLDWAGETNPLEDTKRVSFWNRRVEFSVAKGQTDKGKPDCGTSNAGSGKGSSYSGNKEAGY